MLTKQEKIKRNKYIIKQCINKGLKLIKYKNGWYLVPLENVKEVQEMFNQYNKS